MHQHYVKFMNEYLQLNHMQPVSDGTATKDKTYYIPHHPVFKRDDISKIRVVFNASAKTDNGVSLNDILMIGPTVHQDLYSIMIRFRTHRIVFTADIQKMYRQIQVNRKHIALQRIVWRENSYQVLQTFQLLTVTYGTASAPYLATNCVQQVSKDEQDNYPLAAKRVSRDTYVDDVMTGADNIKKALELQEEIIKMLKAAGFELHKWQSHSNEILSAVAAAQNQSTTIIGQEEVRTLGLLWSPKDDNFKFTIANKHTEATTKRAILSDIATIFDPLGLIGPVILQAKLLMQELWKQKTDWDETVDSNLLKNWNEWRKDPKHTEQLKINRNLVGVSNPVKYEVHGFCDASQAAYGAAIYVRCENDKGDTSMNLISSKSRVAPVKPISLPRLELSEALLLARLISKVKHNLELEISNIYLWTDSMIVLAWLKQEPNKWKVFVANRVSEIQELTTDCTWMHIRSEVNPADYLSRGCNTTKLISNTLWWNGPGYLLEPMSNWPEQPVVSSKQSELPDTRKTNDTFTTLATTTSTALIKRYSNLTKLTRVTAYCLRFIGNTKSPKNKTNGSLTTIELHQARLRLIKQAQQEVFGQEIHKIINNQALPHNSKLCSLNPFLDKEYVLRVGERVQNSKLPYDQKHPIILPQEHMLTQLVLETEHKRLLHAGAQAVLTSIKRHYWPINGKNEIRRIIHNCVTCFRFRAKGSQQIMANLPKERVQVARPFLNTGIDYGGPIFLRTGKRKNAPLEKGYIALFVCLATRAIHLELVSSLSTESLLAALNRFTARRGICEKIYSDNGTNFKGAQHALHELFTLLKNQETRQHIIERASNQGINWRFIPPNAPHFGGIWEAGIKSTKYHLKRTMGKAHLTFEETYTLLTEIEACLNSRPLIPMNNDPTNFEILTPSHFLIGDMLTNIPIPDLRELPVSRLSRWQIIQQMHQEFWKKWSRDYLTHLQQRHKWQTAQPNLQEGKLVLLKEDNVQPLQWPIARIKQLTQGPDGNVRVATIVTPRGTEFQRPIVKLCPLPDEDEEQADPQDISLKITFQGGRDV